MIYRIGIIGCGWVASFHLAALRQLRDRATVVWVADTVEERARAIAEQCGPEIPRILADYRVGLREVDSVFVLLPHHLHHGVTIDALEAGCHVFLEKPMAISVKEADEMIEAAERNGKLLMVALPHRYRSTTRRFKELVQSGEYGRLFMLDAMMDESLKGSELGWIGRRQTLGGGVFFSASSHMLDVMLWIAGDVHTISMVGTHGGLEMEGEDTAVSILKFKNGVIGTTRHTWCSAMPGTWYTMRAFCEDATLTMSLNPMGSLAREGPRCQWRTQITIAPPGTVLIDSDEGLDFTGEVTHFLDCLDTGAPCETDGKTARKLIALISDAYQKAMKEGGLS